MSKAQHNQIALKQWKRKILKPARPKKGYINIQRNKCKNDNSFSLEILQARRERSKIFKVLKEKSCQLRLTSLMSEKNLSKTKWDRFSPRHTDTERTHRQQAWASRNVKSGPSGRSAVPGRKLGRMRMRETRRNSDHVDKHTWPSRWRSVECPLFKKSSHRNTSPFSLPWKGLTQNFL